MSIDGWREVKLGEIANVLSGYAFKSKEFRDEGIPVVKIKNIVPPYVNIDDVQYISKELAEEKSRYKLKYNDILISLTGSNVNQFASAVGKIGRIKINKPMMLNQRVGKFEVLDSSIYDYDFLYYLISTKDMHYKLANNAGGAANQANISPAIIKSIELPCPPINEQQAIAATLSCLDDKIELNNRINKTLEEMAQAIFKSWFVDFEPFQDGEFEDSELGRIPKGWRVLELKDISKFQNGYAFYKVGYSKSGVMVIDLGNVSLLGNFIKTNADKYISGELYNQPNMTKYHVYKNDLVMIMTDRKSTMDLLGKTAKISTNDKYILNQRVGRIRANVNINVNFLYTYLNSEHFLNELKKKALGSVQKYVNTSHITDSKLIVPSNTVMKEFGKMVNPIFEQMEILNQEIQILVNIRDSILPKLMNGEIRVQIEEVQ